MKKQIFILIYEHADLVWRRCFDRDFEYKGQNFVSYSDLEGYYIIENIKLCDKYDFYRFTIESVAMLRKFLEKNPAYEEKVASLIKSKRIFIPFAGDNIIDSNMVCGESIVRNFLYGHYYLKNKYGVQPQQVTRNDAFGNSAQLPQIIRKFGRRWVTHITYSRCDGLYWRGLDGSTVLVYQPEEICSTGGYYKYRPCPACNGYKDSDCPVCKNMRIDLAHMEEMRVKLGEPRAAEGNIPGFIYCGGEEILPTEDVVTWVLQHKEEFDFTFIGFDDYLPYIQDMMDRADSADESRLHSSREVNANNTGCLVTRIKTKQAVRRNENAILAAETMQLAGFLKNGTYPTAEFGRLWEDMLFTIFHDAITATTVDAASDEVMDCCQKVYDTAKGLQQSAVRITREKDTVTVYNPYGQTVSCDVTLSVASEEDIRLKDGEGKDAPISDYKRENGQVTVTFYADKLAAFSSRSYQLYAAPYNREKITVYEINEFNGKPVLTNEIVEQDTDITQKTTTIENEYFIITADANGICEIYDKALDCVVSKSGKYGVAEWILEHDEGSPWATHSTDMRRKSLGQNTRLISVEKTCDMQRLTFYIRPNDTEAYSVMGLRITYTVTLQKNCDMVKFSADVNWHTQNYRLRIAFPSMEGGRHFYDIPYGVIERKPYEPNILHPGGTSNWASAAGDYPAINWAGVEGSSYSLTLFNRGTPSYQIDDDCVIYLSVLRSPSLGSYLYSPAEYTMTDYDGMRDCGDHHFEYAIKAYREGFDKNDAVLDGIAYNAQLFAADGTFSIEGLPVLSCADARIAGVKLSEDQCGMIIRICEYHGKNTSGVLTIPSGIAVKAAWITDLKEDKEEELAVADGKIGLSLKPFEIQTVYLQLK